MWRLLRDQIERSKWLTFVSVLVAGQAAMLGPVLGPLGDQLTNDLGRLFTRLFITTFPAFLAASMGYVGTLADPRFGNAKTIIILPLRHDELARALWLGTAMPGLILGVLVCVLVSLVHLAFGLGDTSRRIFDILVPTILSCSLGSAMSVVMWSYLAVTSQLPETVRRLPGVLLFHMLWYLVWLRTASRFGPLAAESLLIVSLAVSVAAACWLLSPRLWARWRTRRPPTTVATARHVSIAFPQWFGRKSSLFQLAFRVSALAFGFAFLVNVAFLMAIWVHRPLERAFSLPFRLRWMVLVTYAVVWFWFTSWRASLRTLRCLPVSGRKLVVASIGACSLMYLAGSAGILATLALEQGEAGSALRELPFLILLAFGTSLCLAGIALHVQRPNGLHQLFGFGFFVLPNAMFLPIALGDGTWLAGFTSRTWLWSYAGPAAILLTALGVVAIAHGLVLSGTPYRPMPLAERVS